MNTCKRKDVGCGPEARAWCNECPKWSQTTIARHNTEVPTFVTISEANNAHVTTGDPTLKLLEQAEKARKYDQIVAVMSIKNYDGVLAKIRSIIQ